MRRTAALAQKLSTAFPRAHGLPHHLGGAYEALDNAPDRTIHVKIHPRPRSLEESQQVLRQLQRFGEIEVYRHLKYDFEAPAPNSAIAVYKDPDAAQRARAENLIDFEYAAPTRPRGYSPGGAGDVTLDETMEELGPDRYNNPCARPCQLVIRMSTLQHLSLIQRQWYYWPVQSPDVPKPGYSMLGDLPPGLHGLQDFDVTKPEPTVRKRDVMSTAWDASIKAKGWETLEDLWNLGNSKREAKAKAKQKDTDAPNEAA